MMINHYAGSMEHGMEYRPYYLAREWTRMGHRVTILLASFSHLRNQNKECDHAKRVCEEIEGITYLWIPTPAYKGNGCKRLLNMAVFSWRIYQQSAAIADEYRPDIVIAASPHPFAIFGARRMAACSGATLIFEVRDLWPLTLVEIGRISRYHPFILGMQWVENYSYQVAHKVVSLLPQADRYMLKHGMKPEQFFYIPNGIDMDHWERPETRPSPPEFDEIRRLKAAGQFLVGYVGSHGPANALRFFVEAAAHMGDDPVSLVLVGQGVEKAELMRRAQELKLKNVLFLPWIPKRDIPAALAMMDVLYIGWRREKIYRYGISPNKIMDYMMAAKPIIHAVEAANDVVAAAECGISIEPENPQAIADAVRRCYALPAEERAIMGQKGRLYASQRYDYARLARDYLDHCVGEGS